MRPTTNFANNLKSVNLQTPNKRTQTITLLLWNAFMANMSHPLRALIYFGLLAVSAFILTLPRARAQAPPDGAAVPTRPAETARDAPIVLDPKSPLPDTRSIRSSRPKSSLRWPQFARSDHSVTASGS